MDAILFFWALHWRKHDISEVGCVKNGQLRPIHLKPNRWQQGGFTVQATSVRCLLPGLQVKNIIVLRQSSSSASAQSWILTPIISSSSVIWIVIMQLPCHGNWEGVYMVFGMVFLKRWIEFLTMFENCNIFSGVFCGTTKMPWLPVFCSLLSLRPV